MNRSMFAGLELGHAGTTGIVCAVYGCADMSEERAFAFRDGRSFCPEHLTQVDAYFANQKPAPPVKPLARLAVQGDRILNMLTAGPVTNVDLAKVALKYTSRISDLRKAGHRITCKRLSGGLTEYRLAA